MKSKTVNEFRIGDGIQLYGWRGTVVDIDHQTRDRFDDKHEVIGQMPCTYLQVKFDSPTEVGYQYEGGWYGGADDVVAYGYFERS